MKRFHLMKKNIAGMGMLIVAAGLLLTSCLKDKDATDNTNSLAGLMALNLAPGQSSVGFSISTNNLTQFPLGYNEYTGIYLSIFPGTRSVESYSFHSGNQLASASQNFETSKYYSVFLVGTESNLENLIVKDSIDNLASNGKAYVRYIHAIPDASSSQVTVASIGTNAVNESASFKSVSQFVAVDPGQVSISVNNGGTINANRTITLEQNVVYTILLIGKPGGNGNDAVQIRYIANGMIESDAARMGKAASIQTIK